MRTSLAVTVGGLLALMVGVAGAQAFRMDAGATMPHTDPLGVMWPADRPYNPADPVPAGYVGGTAFPGTGVQLVGGSPDQLLFRTAREGMTAYRFDVPAGMYAVSIGLAEVVHHGPGLRRFSILVEGNPLVVDLDLLENVTTSGYTRDYATWRRILVTVSDGRLDIDTSASLGQALVNAIAAVRITADAVAPPAPPPPAAHDGFAGTVVLEWSDVGAPDLAGYAVERAPSPAGPWTPALAGLVPDSRFVDTAPLVGPGSYRVRAVDHWGNQSAPTAVTTARARADSETALPLIEISIAAGDLLVLDQDPFAEVYVPATAIVMGEAQGAPIQVRYRGGVSRKFPKKGWKLNLDGDFPHAGRDKLNLKSEFIEYSAMREEIAYTLMRSRGIAAADARQVQLRVNGAYRGIYLDLEQLDEDFLERHRLDSSGELWKAEQGGDMRPFPTLPEYEGPWTRETATTLDNTNLDDLCRTVATSSAAAFPRAIAARLDVNEFLDYWAIRVFLGDTDFTFHNYYVYRSSIGRFFQLLPWDLDHTFGNVGPFATMIRTDTPVDAGSMASPLGPGGGLTGPFNRLYERMMSVPLFRDMYCRKLEALMAGELSAAVIDPRIDAAHQRILVDALADVTKCGWEEAQRFLEGPTLCHLFVPARAAWLAGAIAGYRPAFDQSLFLNEVLVLNDGVALDEVGEAEPYVELWSTAAMPVDLSGKKLASDPRLPSAFTFPGGTLLAPGAHLIVWCDGEPGDGPLHTSFALDGQGGMLALFEPDDLTLVDCIHWGREYVGLALARQGDGGALFARMTPTPAAPNGTTAANLPPVVWAHDRQPVAPADFQAAAVSIVVDDDSGLPPVSVTLTYDAGAGAVVLAMADDGVSLDGAAGDGRYGATIPGFASGTTVDYEIVAIDSAGASGRSPEGAGFHSYTVSGGPCVPGCGDCNGDLVTSVLDALVAAQHAVGVLVLVSPEFERCDVDASTIVDILDALQLARASLGLVTLTCC